MKKLYSLLGILIFTAIGISTSEAHTKFKNRYAIGLSYNPEWVVDNKGMNKLKFQSIYAISGEAQFSKHSGIELDVGLRHYKRTWEGYPNSIEYKENFISLKLGYKFYSGIINFKAGISTDFYVANNDWEDHLIGVFFSISKDIILYKRLIVEPEIRYNLMGETTTRDGGSSKSRNLLGGGVKLKYRF